jgi:hypothetical protein
MVVQTVQRPYTLTFRSGHVYDLTSEEAQLLIDSVPVVRANRQRVLLRGDDGQVSVLEPATLGGGDAFVVTR